MWSCDVCQLVFACALVLYVPHFWLKKSYRLVDWVFPLSKIGQSQDARNLQASGQDWRSREHCSYCRKESSSRERNSLETSCSAVGRRVEGERDLRCSEHSGRCDSEGFNLSKKGLQMNRMTTTALQFLSQSTSFLALSPFWITFLKYYVPMNPQGRHGPTAIAAAQKPRTGYPETARDYRVRTAQRSGAVLPWGSRAMQSQGRTSQSNLNSIVL